MSKPWTPPSEENTPLPEELSALAEALAESVHNAWARERIRAGWTYGPERNDELKQTPLLVPYQQLPESEKDVDRATAAVTLRGILRLGFEIRKVIE